MKALVALGTLAAAVTLAPAPGAASERAGDAALGALRARSLPVPSA
jgi:hypothetical protein